MLDYFTIYRALLLKDDRETKTLMHQIRITGTVLVTPFLIGGAAFGVWDVADKIKNWQSMTPGGTWRRHMQCFKWSQRWPRLRWH